MAEDSEQPQTAKSAKEIRAKLGIDIKMLELLVCPLTHKSLEVNIETAELISIGAKLAYPVRGGIPIMLPSEARELTEKELEEYSG
jgi:hypothetical protein